MGFGDPRRPHEELYGASARAILELGRVAPTSRLDVRRALHQGIGGVDRGSQERSMRGAEIQEGVRPFAEKLPPAWSLLDEGAPLPAWATPPLS